MRGNPLLHFGHWYYFGSIIGLGFAAQAGFLWYRSLASLPWCLLEAIISWGTLAVMALALANVPRYYQPQRAQGLLIIVLPLLPVFLLSVGYARLLPHLPYPSSLLAFAKSTLYQRAVGYYLLLAGATLVSYGWLRLQYWRKQAMAQQEVQHYAREAELYKLRQQLQPHFIFNALHSINALIGQRPQEARAMVQRLSEFLRATLRYDEQSLIPLQQEWSRLEQYLAIEKVRFGRRLQVESNLHHFPDFPIPPLILQPLLENAIKHGLYGTVQLLTVTLQAELREPNLHLKICNPYDADYESGKSDGGFGLSSVKRRLQLLYGRSDLLQITRTKPLFCVTLKIPRAYDQSITH